MSLGAIASDDPAVGSRRRPWMLTWAVALGVFVSALLAIELAWRHLGYRPSVTDSPALWQFWQHYAAGARERGIVLIGSSRMQTGVSTSRMRDRLTNYRVGQLSQYTGLGSIGVLRHIAADESFNGIVICDTLAPFFLRANWDDQHELYTYPVGPRAEVEALASAKLQDVLATKHAGTGVFAMLKALLNGQHRPRPNRMRIRADRSLDLDFSKLEGDESLADFVVRDVERARRRYAQAELETPDELQGELEMISVFVQRIQQRGGHVVFVRMPSSGARLDLEEEFHPKSEYWDRFAEASSAICLHFEQIEGARELPCPDGSHLDHEAAIAFTDALIEELAKRGLCDTR